MRGLSTAEQTAVLQEDALRAAGCSRIWLDTASGTKTDRPQLAAVFDHLRVGDTIGGVVVGPAGSVACTPGAVDPHVTDATLESTVCRRGGYTSTVRPPTGVTNSEKRLAQTAYGQSDGPSAYELDHLVPLESGGTPNSAANLWPEPGSSPNPKDKLEGALHDLLCARRITLTAAQHMIATDWITAYRQILGTPPPG